MTRDSRRLLKRLLDALCGGAGLVLLSPLLGVAALGVLAGSGRPILFRQLRPGLHGRLFSLCKFRTMRSPKAGEGGHFRTDALRLTRIGRLLRATSIDELPELWTVLKGEMSLVGPRPLLPEYLMKYTPEQARRHDVLPGITGWAQVNGRQTIPFSKRLALDVWYVDNWSLALDLKILMLTVVDVFRFSGVVSGQNVDEVDDLGLTQAGPGDGPCGEHEVRPCESRVENRTAEVVGAERQETVRVPTR